METSPTGKALIPPASVPYIAAGIAALGALSLSLPDGKLKAVLQGVLAVVGPLAGVLCPGLRSKPNA